MLLTYQYTADFANFYPQINYIFTPDSLTVMGMLRVVVENV